MNRYSRSWYEAVYEHELEKLSDTSKLENKRAAQEEKLQEALSALQTLIRENQQYKQDQSIYLEKYNTQKAIVDEKKQALEEAKKAIMNQISKKEKLRRFMAGLELCEDEVDGFDDKVFSLVIDRILVKKGKTGTLVFCFTDGSEITERLEN